MTRRIALGSTAIVAASACALLVACISIVGDFPVADLRDAAQSPSDDAASQPDVHEAVDAADVMDAGPTCSEDAQNCQQGLTCCGRTCVDLTQSGANCGACGHDCFGGLCSLGVCQPAALVSYTNAADLDAIIVDDTSVYWMHPSLGRILKCSRSGCATPTPLVDIGTPFVAGQLTQDGPSEATGHVYWLPGGPNGPQRCAKTSPCATPSPIPSPWTFSIGATVLAADSQNLYFGLSDGSIHEFNLGVGGDVVLGTSAGSSARGLAVNASSVYWPFNDMDASPSGGFIFVAQNGIAMSGQRLYGGANSSAVPDLTNRSFKSNGAVWFDGRDPTQDAGGQLSTVYTACGREPVDGSTSCGITPGAAFLPGIEYLGGFVPDEASLYWIGIDSQGHAQVRHGPVPGRTLAVIDGVSSRGVSSLAMDSSSLYFLVRDTLSKTTLYRLAR